MKLSLIAARSDNDVIGRGGDIPWHLPADLSRFKRLTTGHAVIMGRRTYESIGRSLPDRRIVVLTRNPEFAASGVTVVHPSEVPFAPDEAEWLFNAAGEDPEVFVAGGAEIYGLALPYADRMYLTCVHTVVAGDTVFPSFLRYEWRLTDSEHHTADAKNPFDYTFEVWEKRGSGEWKADRDA